MESLHKEWTHSTPLSNFIEVHENMVPSVVCQELIKFYEKEGNWDGQCFNIGDLEKDYNYNVKAEEIWINPTMEFYPELSELFSTLGFKYAKKHKFKMDHASRMRLNKYEKGGFMRLHCDAIRHSHGQKYGYPHITLLSILNSEFEGGEFVLVNKKYNFKTGDVVIFPSGFMFEHGVNEITKGTRYSLMTWMM